MPEGDSVHRHAALLRPLLQDAVVVSADSRWPDRVRGLVGHQVVGVRALGKNLLIGFDDDSTVRVHLGMKGSWRQYRADEPLGRSVGELALLLGTDEHQVACWSAPVVERLRTTALALHPPLHSLGPDVLAESFELPEVLRRVATTSRSTVVEVLLDQRTACGLGNVYKSELCFVHRLDPFALPSQVAPETWEAMYERARDWMQRNLGPGPRDTTFLGPRRPRHWVYGRSGRACLRCSTPVRSRTHGEGIRRTTYWCPSCQRAR